MLPKAAIKSRRKRQRGLVTLILRLIAKKGVLAIKRDSSLCLVQS